MMLRRPGATLLSAAMLAGSVPAEAQVRLRPPEIRAQYQEHVPDFQQAPDRRDLHSLINHLKDCIIDTEVPVDRVPGVDFFLQSLEQRLAPGVDIPLAEIAWNADSAREGLRLSYNDMAKAESNEHLARIRRELRRIAERLPALVERNRESLRNLEDAAATGRNTAHGMNLEPPSSPGSEVAVERLEAIVPLRREIEALEHRLHGLDRKLAQARGFISRAKRRSAVIGQIGQNAAKLDRKSMDRLGQRRTSGRPVAYQTRDFSSKVILHANEGLTEAVARAEEVLELIERQLNPEKEGIRKALEQLARADAKATLGKERQRQSGKRINWNHRMRMNDAIMKGYAAATDKRRAWWVGRSQMAISEAKVDAWKMEDAWRQADETHRKAEEVARQAVETIFELDKALGAPEGRPALLAKRELDIPEIRDPGGEPIAAGKRRDPKSKKLKIPRTFSVSNDEILGAYDGRSGY